MAMVWYCMVWYGTVWYGMVFKHLYSAPHTRGPTEALLVRLTAR